MSNLSDESGSVEKIIAVSDITDRKLAEYALRTAEKLGATGKLANAIAHEINNPFLEAITNLLFLARSSDSPGFVQELLKLATVQMDRVSRVTKQTLAFHRDTEYPIPVDAAEPHDRRGRRTLPARCSVTPSPRQMRSPAAASSASDHLRVPPASLRKCSEI